MSSGWVRCSVLIAPPPTGWKLCFSVVPKAICLAVSVLLEAPALGLALGGVELELEEHPAAPSRPAAMTVAPSEVAVRRLKVFTELFVCDPSDARRSKVNRAGERRMARRGPNSKDFSTLGSRAGSAWVRVPADSCGQAARRCSSHTVVPSAASVSTTKMPASMDWNSQNR